MFNLKPVHHNAASVLHRRRFFVILCIAYRSTAPLEWSWKPKKIKPTVLGCAHSRLKFDNTLSLVSVWPSVNLDRKTSSKILYLVSCIPVTAQLKLETWFFLKQTAACIIADGLVLKTSMKDELCPRVSLISMKTIIAYSWYSEEILLKYNGIQ